MRSVAASTRLRTSVSKLRTFNLMMASSGITFSLVPACRAPIVTTADSAAASSRETMVCSRIIVAAGVHDGVRLAFAIGGCEPAGVGEAGSHFDRQRVHIGPQHYRPPF